jgi:hypothetical protein
MPDLDEDTIRELMLRSTDDLFASPSTVAAALKRQRRRNLRGRALGVAGTAAAAGLAAGVLASGAHGSGPSASGGGPSASGGLHLAQGGTKNAATPIRLTSAQRALFSLSTAAAKTPRPNGRYVVLKEIATTKETGGGVTSSEIGGKTSVIDTITGGGVTYQDITVSGAGGPPPAVLNAPAGSSPTVSQLDALPTDPVALRAALLAQAEQQQRQAQQLMNQKLKKFGSRFKAIPEPKYHQTPDDLVFEQATDLLWEPDLSPQLRSALYRVLAATPGVVVSTGVNDSADRPATEISRVTSAVGDKAEVFENPATGATLESAWSYQAGEFDEDLYQSITYTSTIPPDPYQS